MGELIRLLINAKAGVSTDTQLGYIVELATRNDSGIRGAKFSIQSTVKDPTQLDLRVETFLKMFERKLHTMSDDQVSSSVPPIIGC